MRWRLTAAALAAAVVACSSGSGGSGGGSGDSGGSEGAEPAATASVCDPALDEAFGAWAEAGFSGSIAITSSGEPDCVAAYGLADRERATPNTPEAVFSIGSVSKAFTAAAVLRLVDGGELALDDRAGDLLPGPIDGRTLAGTVVGGGELRTYVTLSAGDRSMLVWYALDDEGGVSAAEIDTDPPSVALGAVPAVPDTYRPDDPTASGPDVTVTFPADGDQLTIDGPTGATATRAAS